MQCVIVRGHAAAQRFQACARLVGAGGGTAMTQPASVRALSTASPRYSGVSHVRGRSSAPVRSHTVSRPCSPPRSSADVSTRTRGAQQRHSWSQAKRSITSWVAARWQAASGGGGGRGASGPQHEQARKGTGASTGPPASGSAKLAKSAGDKTAAADDSSEEQQVAAEPGRVAAYFRAWLGEPGAACPPRPALAASITAGAAAFVGIGLLSAAHYGMLHDSLAFAEATILLGSFGATAALAYGVPASPFSQPRNIIGGHMLSGAIGVATYQVMVGMLGMSTWMAAPVAVSLAIVGMEQTRTLHPPAAATGLIAVIGPQLVHDMGYWYVLMPCGVGSTALVLVGVMLNNLRPGVSYPKYWW